MMSCECKSTESVTQYVEGGCKYRLGGHLAGKQEGAGSTNSRVNRKWGFKTVSTLTTEVGLVGAFAGSNVA